MADPGIKLFGKTIQLPEIAASPSGADSSSGGGVIDHQDQEPASLPDSSVGEENMTEDDGVGGGDGGCGGEEEESEKEMQDENVNDCGEEHVGDSSNPESGAASSTSGLTDKVETPKSKSAKTEEEAQNETGASSQETKLKKPDKILPCPRCNSMDTKFCYYNNYNVNQPRHFCKNCQRYWTAGGTMRNVPVGAGRRKNKNSAAHFNRHVNISAAEAMQKSRTDLQHPNGTNLLTFGSDQLLCESMASGLNLADKAMLKTRNGFHEPPEGLKIQIPYENNVNASTNPPNEEAGTSGSLPKVPCFPPPPAWPYGWNGVPWTVLPFYPPPAYWSCPAVPPATWNSFPWMAQPNSPSGSGPNSPTLGKHSRDENVAEPGTSSKETEPSTKEKSNPERCLWVPKTLRIDDPEEAAKSSIWETLGIKNDKKTETFRAFRSNKEKSSRAEETPPKPLPRPALQANPAALSRSANFHESS